MLKISGGGTHKKQRPGSDHGPSSDLPSTAPTPHKHKPDVSTLTFRTPPPPSTLVHDDHLQIINAQKSARVSLSIDEHPGEISVSKHFRPASTSIGPVQWPVGILPARCPNSTIPAYFLRSTLPPSASTLSHVFGVFRPGPHSCSERPAGPRPRLWNEVVLVVAVSHAR